MPKRILVADDSALMLKLVQRLIEQEPAWVVTGQAANGREAIEKVSELNPDLVILDLSMPVMNGLDAACELSRIKPDLPLVMFTNNPERFVASFQPPKNLCQTSRGFARYMQKAPD